MEKELNIAAILRDKNYETKFWSPIFGDAYLKDIDDYDNIHIMHHGIENKFLKNGKIWADGEVCLFPSKQMRDWSKFAWKRGDVLQISHIGFCTFEEWTSNDYTTFKGRYGVGLGKNNDHDYDVKEDLTTSMWYKVDNKDFIKEYLSTVEKQFGGKLNLKTLEIEKPQFKDGDIVTATFLDDGTEMVCVFKEKSDEFYMGYCGVFTTGRFKQTVVLDFGEDCISEDKDCHLRLATDSEKQQLFDALAKENKAWDAEKNAIVDLPKKYKFKTMDYFLARYNYSKDALWNLYQYAFTDKDGYIFVVNESCIEADKYTSIPYNDQTAHLLGTTDDWKGGE